jgi:peptide chain release factor 3
MGKELRGVYSMYEKRLLLFQAHTKAEQGSSVEFSDLSSPDLEKYIFEQADTLREEVELIEGVYPEFDRKAYLKGEVSPVFFGSAVNNFGVRELLDAFVEIAPQPQPSKTAERMIEPMENKFAGFVFKIHANMDPKHRDRIAFVKICSGVFERNKAYKHIRSGKDLKFSNPTSFMAEKKTIVDRKLQNWRCVDRGRSTSFQGHPDIFTRDVPGD